MGGDLNHQRDYGSREGPNISDKGRVHHMGDFVPIILTQLHIKNHSFFSCFSLVFKDTNMCLV